MNDNSLAIHGSARWADINDLRAGELLGGKGLPFGFSDGQILKYDTDAPRLLVGGSGSGKLTGILSYCLCLPNRMPMAILDPKGELWSISVHGLAVQGIFAYAWDPFEVGDVHHTIDPLTHLTPNNVRLFPEIVRLVTALIPLSGAAGGKYFELTAQNLLIALIYCEVLVRGRIDFPRLYTLIHMVEGDLHAWADMLEAMLGTENAFLISAANAIMRSQQDTPKEFGGVMGEIYAYMRWLADDAVRASLASGGQSLEELVRPDLNGGHPVRVYFKVPGELLEFCAPILRVFFDSIMTLKARHPASERVFLLVDEAAMLGRFNALKTAFSYGRGTGITTLAVFQDLMQIESAFGRPAVTTFIGSSAHRQFIGPRDTMTAGVISSMCGFQTLRYDDKGRQEEARFHLVEQVNALLDGADPFVVGQKAMHFYEAAHRQSKIKRALIDPAEVLAMRSDEAISFIDGDDLPPILHNKYPYFEVLEAGQFFPNPAHPPRDKIRVAVQGRFRRRYEWRVVRRVPVPHRYAHFPQLTHGEALEIEGHPLD